MHYLTKIGLIRLVFYQETFAKCQNVVTVENLAMPDGAAVAAASMAVEMQRINLVSHNLANALTPAYKRIWPVTVSFNDLFRSASVDRISSSESGVRLDQAVDFRSVPLRKTGNSLDVAIEGKGFFEMRDGENTYFSRQGNFELDGTGRLTTTGGVAVAGLGGDIRLQSAQVRIDSLGHIYEKDQQVAQLKVVAFDDPAKLVPVGAGRYMAGKATMHDADTNIILRQGYIEASNVVAADEMVRLIESMRRFEGGQKVIQWYDGMLEKALTRLGEF